MKNSLKLLTGLATAIAMTAGVSLAAVAQTNDSNRGVGEVTSPNNTQTPDELVPNSRDQLPTGSSTNDRDRSSDYNSTQSPRSNSMDLPVNQQESPNNPQRTPLSDPSQQNNGSSNQQNRSNYRTNTRSQSPSSNVNQPTDSTSVNQQSSPNNSNRTPLSDPSVPNSGSTLPMDAQQLPPGNQAVPLQNPSNDRMNSGQYSTPNNDVVRPNSQGGATSPSPESVNPQRTPVSDPSNSLDRRSQTGSQYNSMMSNADLDTVIRTSPSFEMFNALLRVADEDGSLATKLASGKYTVFAPTDEAFAALPPGAVKMLVQPENREMLQEILSSHIISGNVPSSAVQTGTSESINGETLNLQAGANGVTVNQAQVIQPDISASNGVIHAINRVILPAEVQANLSRFSTSAGSYR